MQKRKSILGLSLAAVLVLGLSGCGDHKGPFSSNSKKDGVDVSIERFGGAGSPLKQKVIINEGEMLAVHADVKNLGTLDAESVELSCVMRRTPTDDYTLTYKQELTGVLKSSETHKQNIFIDGTAALEPGDYNLSCNVIASEDVDQDNNKRAIQITIKGDGEQ